MTSNNSTEPKELSLFHYVSEFSYLVDMLQLGMWPRYCVEEIEWLVGVRVFIAFPMKCFCDIPVNAANVHRDRYGNYALAISKNWAAFYDINPMWYVQEGTSISKHLASLVQDPVRTTLDTMPIGIKPMLPYIKSTEGAQLDRKSRVVGALEQIQFEEEMEWRYSPLSLMHTWKLGSDRNLVQSSDHNASLVCRKKIDFDHIEIIYVPSQAEADGIIQQFSSLAGKVAIWSP